MRTAARAPRTRVKGPITPQVKERKFSDLAQANYACDTTGTVTALNLIAVGDDYNTRDGRQATMKHVQVRGFLTPVDASTLAQKVRIMLVWDNAANGSLATVAQILNQSTGTGFPLVDNQNRFTILADESYTLGAISTTATQSYAASPTVHDVEIFRQVNAVTQYSGTTAAIGSIQNGALLMLTIGTAATADSALFVASTRTRFVDL